MAALPAIYTTSSEQYPIDALVIGAGPAGVVSLRNLLKVNLNAIAIERQSAVGGLWIDHTPSYSSLQVLRADWALHGVPCGIEDDDQRRFLRDDVCEWIQQYVDSQGIGDNIFLNTEVVKVVPLKPMLFQVDLCSVEKCGYLGGGKRVENSLVRIYTRAVLVCAGIFTDPVINSDSTGLENRPFIPKFEGDETATFPIKHNWDIRTAEDLPEDDILIIGGGPSSMDIAQEATITKGAQNVTLATRKPHLGLPDKWGPLLPFATGAKWLWDRSWTEIRILFKLYRTFPAPMVDWFVNRWSSWWAGRHSIPEWHPVGTVSSRFAS
jgi:Flavin-binding monooxygenase-like